MFIFSEVKVGELDLESAQDCVRTFCAESPQTLRVEKVIKHEKWNLSAFKKGYDIALVRVKGSIKFFFVSHLTIGVLKLAFSDSL